ncbi:MAG TPA: shikimate kinase [Rhizomicrobium sp.]|nr:shikimate kinase [Rhizomicrobium sp.]
MAVLKRTVALIGMMGAGKSTVGRMLARRLETPFRDADSEIETAAGCTVSEIFARFGEAEFRDGERRVILRLLGQPPHVLAMGGGAILDAATRAAIAKDAVSVWLRAPVSLLLARVSRRDTRPLLQGGNARETLERLLAEREPLYAQADIVVDTEAGPHSLAVGRIVEALAARGIVELP